ncbi:MAG TPA: PEP-utilizing enzyme [Candidatus Methylomirabilis sp.]|nr:PEP-utilizing enzyme [Candidatus Methylomirabilis sp.]
MGADGKTRSFLLPSQIRDVPGAEGWRSMYPYYTRFQPEDDGRFWFYNAMHFPEPMPPFDAITAEVPYEALGAFTTRIFVFPTTLGIEHRIVNGRIYITANPVLDGGEIQRRLKIFQERAGFYYENWQRLFEEWKARLLQLIRELEAIRVPKLPEFDDGEVVLKAKGLGQNHFIKETFHRTIELYSKMWHHHFEMLMLGYGAYMVFFDFCKKAFPETADQTVARMVAGIEVLMFRPDDELKRLAKLAIECGVDDLFTAECNAEKVLAALGGRGEAGRRWLAELDKSREPWFHMSTGDGFYHHHLSWNDDLSVPFAALPRYVEQLKQGMSLERPTERLKAERQRITSEYRELLRTEQERQAFDQMLGLCHLVFPLVENHKFYCEHWFTTLFFKKVREFGALLAAWGILAQAGDVFQLQYGEIESALADVSLAWAGGGKPLGAAHWLPIVEERKRMVEKLKEWSPPPALGPIPEAINDPALQMLWGITSETLESWSSNAQAADGKEIVGFAASPGVAEGVARVLKDVNDIGQIRNGEILVCPVTAPSWGPVFGKIKAAVSDIGGTMSHAAIVAREYGLPAVVGTGQATQRIKTGQRLRVDGDRGIVRILD